MNTGAARPLDPELLGFLQTLVTEGSQQQQERTDSNKENEAGLNTITEEEPSVSSQQQPVTTKTQPSPGEDGRGVNVPSDNDNHQKKMGDKDVWNDFYNEDDIKKDKENEANEEYADEQFETLDRVEEEEEDNSRSQVMGDESGSNAETQKTSSKKKKKRVFKRVNRPLLPPSAPTVTGGSHPNLSRPGNEHDRHGNQMETMSDTAGRGRRKLNKRKQVARARCVGAQSSGDVLQQKYQELQTLLVTPIVEPGQQLQQTRQELRQIQGLSQQSVAHTMNCLPPTVTESVESGYATLRTVQIVNRPGTAQNRRLPPSGQSQRRRPFSAGNQRENSREVNNRSRDVNRNFDKSSSGNYSHGRGKNESSERSNGSSVGNSARSDTNDDDSKNLCTSSEEENRDRSDSRSPGRAIVNLDTYLEHSNNPALRQWLKRKKKELRKQKTEERKKTREERLKKQEEETKKQEYFKDSDEKVKEWMKKKRKEAWSKAREERRKRREEEEKHHEMEQRQLQYSRVFTGRGIERPASAQTHHDKKMLNFIPVIRPETAGGQKTTEAITEQKPTPTTENVTPQPPSTKFVYRRPVSGRVRLMKLQQVRKEDAKKAELEQKLAERKLAEEKAKKMRMSYDQWLLRKRDEDYAKRQEAVRQKALAKSDPELERIVSDVARRRIENIQKGKKRINTGIRKINEEVNKSFGGSEFGTESEGERETTQASYRLEVSGSQTSLKPRPSSAKPALNPKISKSPQRPKSANPRVQAIMNADESVSNLKTHPFKLPFPPENGVPRHVDAKQKKLFAPQVFETASLGQENVDNSQKNEAAIQPPERNAASETAPAKEDETAQANGESADDKSFFVTDGNLGDSEQGKMEAAAPNGDDCEESQAAEMSEEVPEEAEASKQETEDQRTSPDAEVKSDNDFKNSQEDEEQREGESTVEQEQEGDEEQGEIEEEITTDEGEDQEKETDDQEQEEGQETENQEEEQKDVLVEQESGEITEINVIEQASETVTNGQDKGLTPNLNDDQTDGDKIEFKEENHLDFIEQNEGNKDEQTLNEFKSKHNTKRVSFQEETTVYEPSSAPGYTFFMNHHDDNDDDDEAEDERGDCGTDTPRNEDDENDGF